MEISKLFPTFPTPIILYNYGQDSHDMNVSLLESIFKEKDNDKDGNVASNMGGWHSKLKMEERYSSFQLLKDKIEECSNDYCRQTGYKEGLVVERLWANVSGPGDINMPHHHGRSCLTGVYYPLNELKDNKMECRYVKEASLLPGSWDGKNGGSVVFTDPAYGQKIRLEEGDDVSPFTVQHYHLYPVAGLLAVFPAHLIHTVTPFKDKKVRVSISFVCKYGTD